MEGLGNAGMPRLYSVVSQKYAEEKLLSKEVLNNIVLAMRN